MNNLYGLWCDDITFCPVLCERLDCPRNQKNIRDRTIPHSYSVEIPTDCLKKEEEFKTNVCVPKGKSTIVQLICPCCGKKIGCHISVEAEGR